MHSFGINFSLKSPPPIVNNCGCSDELVKRRGTKSKPNTLQMGLTQTQIKGGQRCRGFSLGKKKKNQGQGQKEICSRTLFRWFNKTSLYGIGELMEWTRAYPPRNQWTYMNPLWRPLTQINLTIHPLWFTATANSRKYSTKTKRIRQTALPYIHVSLWDFLVPSFVSQCSCKTTTNYCFYLNRGLDVSGLVIYSPDVVLKGSWCTEFFFSFCREIGVSVLNHSPAPVKYRRQKGHDDVRTTVWCTHGSFWLIVNRTDIKKKKKNL